MYFHRNNIGSDIAEEYRRIIDKIITDIDPIDTSTKSTQNGVQYQLFNQKYFETLYPIVSTVRNQVCSLLSISNIDLRSAWTVLGKKGTYHTCHRHNTNDDIATVLYLESPNSNGPEGNFYFFDTQDVHEIKPKKGDLLIFPVTVFHGAYPQGEGLRQTLNLDFSRY